MRDRMKRLIPPLATIAAVALLAACQPKHMTPQAWDSLVNEFLDSTFAARPDIAVNAGRHEFDGRLPDWSDAGLENERGRLEEWRARIDKADTVALDTARRIERQYMIAVIDGQLFWLERADWPHRNPTFYTDALDPDVYVSRAYAPLDTRLRAYIAYARSVPGAARQIQANLRTPLPRTFIDRGVGAFGGFATFYGEDVPKVFASVADPALQAEFKVGERQCDHGDEGSRGLARDPQADRDRGLRDGRRSCSRTCSGRPNASTRRSTNSTRSRGPTSPGTSRR